MDQPPVLAWLAEQYVKERLLNRDNGFNAMIQITSDQYGTQPFQLTETGPDKTLYLGRYTAAELQKASGMTASVNYPLAILSIVKADSVGRQALRVTPSTFSGQVIMSLDFYVSFPQGDIPEDGNSMFCAVLDATAMALNAQASYNVVPQGLAYNNEIMAEQGAMTWDGSRWLMFVPMSFAFNIIG